MPSYVYLEVPAGDPADLDDPFAVSKSRRRQAEHQFSVLGLLRVERQDLVDGRRVYRVIKAEQQKLPHDNIGLYVTDVTGGRVTKLRFALVDPSEDQAIRRTWKNVTS